MIFPGPNKKFVRDQTGATTGARRRIFGLGPRGQSVGDSSTIGVIKEKKDGLDKSIAYFDMVWASLIELFKLKII